MSRYAAPLPPVPYLHQRFDYDPEGFLVWKHTGKLGRCENTWNTRFVGRRAGKMSLQQYRVIELDGKKYLASRLIWGFHNGDPFGYIVDHKDTVPYHDWIGNLRLATGLQNGKNKIVVKKSGLPKGVSKVRGTFYALVNLGLSDTPSLASDKIDLASDKLKQTSDFLRYLMERRDLERRGVGSKRNLPRGVLWKPQHQAYHATLSLGGFSTAEEAGMAYREASTALFGEFVRF